MAKNIQDAVLNALRKEKKPCTVITTNGFQIKDAVIVSFDSFSIWFEVNGKQTLMFKHAISSISPTERIEPDYD